MKKTSLYMRKRRPLLDPHGCLVKKHPMAVLRECRTFNEADGTQANAVDAMNMVNAAFVRMAEGSSTNVDDFDYLSHAIGVAEIRAVEIAGRDGNPMLDIINAANDALRRCRARYLKWNKLELDKTGATQVCDALDIYKQILMESSPRQMSDSVTTRLKVLKEMQCT